MPGEHDNTIRYEFSREDILRKRIAHDDSNKKINKAFAGAEDVIIRLLYIRRICTTMPTWSNIMTTCHSTEAGLVHTSAWAQVSQRRHFARLLRRNTLPNAMATGRACGGGGGRRNKSCCSGAAVAPKPTRQDPLKDSPQASVWQPQRYPRVGGAYDDVTSSLAERHARRL